MRHRPLRSRSLLLTATVLTVLAVLVGVLVAPHRGAAPELTAVEQPVVLAVESQVTARQVDVSRSIGRGLVRARSASSDTLPPYQVKPAGAPIRKLPPPPTPGTPFTFQIGTLNVLGSQHTRGSRRYGPGTSRAGMLADAILGRGVDVVGLQEVQDDQLAVLRSRLGGYTIWPGQALGNNGVRLQIAFRNDLFELVDTGSITTVFDRQTRPVPYVLLRNRATQGEFYVIDVHNSPRNLEAERDAATGAEIALVNRLRATGRPVLLVGDTNEHTEFFCRVAAATGMVGSNGGNAAGGCSVGAGPIKIDWVMGGGGVAFSGHSVDYGAPIPAATDHAFVHATVTVTPMVPGRG
ncbi:endonuclease/exonuclease/phosphatase family protein [Nocardioides sp.]|uniref:endonuclease/exonuclease/phosphatase family protein n=1 Tax=Nocardioides sp. TaxID=35761 RepID=UPI0035615141